MKNKITILTGLFLLIILIFTGCDEKNQNQEQTTISQKTNTEELAKQTDTTRESIPSTSPSKPKILNSLNELSSDQAQVGSEVVVGYIWNSTEESPNFSSVVLPIWGISKDKNFMKNEYIIDIWDGEAFIFYTKSVPLKEVLFPQGGVSKFKVTGISPEYAICPGDRSSHTWQLKFASDGEFKGERLPIVIDVSSQGKSCQVKH